MNKKTVIFTIELSDRELLGKILLAIEMVKKGFRVYIGTFRAIHEIRGKLKSCVFFHKSSYERRAKYYKKKMGAVFAVMDEEAGIAIPAARMEDFCKFRYGALTRDAYDYVFTIGDSYSRRLIEMQNMKGIEIVSTGWPRIDLWREEYSAMHAEKIQEIRQVHGEYWLFVSSFGFTSKAGFEHRLRKSYSPQNEKSVRNVYRALNDYIDLLKQLADNGDRKIIVRPHTSESIEEWASIFSKYPNVLVVREGDITPWLLGAEGVITYRSTVNVQAALNGIPTVQYKINEIDGIDDLVVFKVSKCANSVDEVIEYLDSFKNASEKRRLKSLAGDILKDHVSSLVGPTAASRIAAVLAKVDVQPQPEINVNPIERAMSYTWDRYKYLESRVQRLVFRKGAYRMSRFEKVPNGIKAQEIQYIVERLQSVSPTEAVSISCHQVSTNLVVLDSAGGIFG